MQRRTFAFVVFAWLHSSKRAASADKKNTAQAAHLGPGSIA
jgi:hypothetical protein